MEDSDIQQIFLCPRCNAQNVVGQVVCQTCEQRFQYNCPFCGHTVDPTLVNCPSCRGSLNWPTPQKVRAFPKQKRAAQHKEPVEFDETKSKPKKKNDPWLMGCLILIALVIIAGIAIWILDTFAQQAPSAIPAPYPVSSNQTSAIETGSTILGIS
jgi:hypothetical protein